MVSALGIVQRAERAVVRRARPDDVEPLPEGIDDVEALGEPADRALNGAHGQLVLGELHDQRHHEVVWSL